ncbi:MAG: UPF0179 family protein [Thermoplasmata archaeon]
MTIALVGKRMAKKDFVFQFLGSALECRDCALKNICSMLSPGKYYRITNVREKEHSCKIHDLNSVVTVEVEEMATPIAIEKKMAIEGLTSQISQSDCKEINCKYFDLCYQPWWRENQKVRVEKIGETIECPKGKNLVKVYVRW